VSLTAIQLDNLKRGHVFQQTRAAANRKAYQETPKKCLSCGQDISLREGVTVHETNKKKFCNRSCAAKYNNFGSARNPSRIKDWQPIQKFYDSGKTCRECLEAFGISRSMWYAAVKANKITQRPQRKIPLQTLLCVGTHAGRKQLKRRLLAEGFLSYVCAVCGISTWINKPLVLILDHINGKNDDCRLENLRLLCPNCNSQTDTFCGRNVGKHRTQISTERNNKMAVYHAEGRNYS